MKKLIFLFPLLSVTFAQQNGTNVCPVLVCGGEIPSGLSSRLCYIHNANIASERKV